MSYLKQRRKEIPYITAHGVAAIIHSDHPKHPLFVLHIKNETYPFEIFRNSLCPIGGRASKKDEKPIDTLWREIVDEELRGKLGRDLANTLKESEVKPYIETLVYLPKKLMGYYEDVYSYCSYFEMILPHNYLIDVFEKDILKGEEIYIEEDNGSILFLDYISLDDCLAKDMKYEHFLLGSEYLLAHFINEKYNIRPNFNFRKGLTAYKMGTAEDILLPFKERNLPYRETTFSD